MNLLQGINERFSTFASRSVKLLEEVPEDLRLDRTRASVGFEHYDSLDIETRVFVIDRAREVITSLMNTGVLSPRTIQFQPTD